MSVGIDALYAYVPKLYVDLQGEWSEKRAKVFTDGDSEKLRSKCEKGIGLTKIAFPDGHEDPATMAAMAIKNLVEKNDISLSDVGYLAVASETGVDHSKSMSSYVLGMLEEYFGKSYPEMGCPEFKFACIGSTYALESAVSLVESGRLGKKYAIVVTTDIAKYELESQAEYTQGAGAVALLISEHPRVLEISKGPFFSYSRDERDFFRPLWRTTPVVDGKYSMDIYNECVDKAFERYLDYNANENKGYGDVVSEIDKMIFHVPFPRMAKHASTHLLAPFVTGTDLSKLDKAERKQFEKEFSKSEEFNDIYTKKVNGALSIAGEVGNVYTGSIFLGLISLLESSFANGEELKDQNIVFSAYGSGSSAKIFSGKIAPLWKEVAKGLKTLGERISLSVEDYERLHNERVQAAELSESVQAPQGEFGIVGYGNEPHNEGLRIYKYHW